MLVGDIISNDIDLIFLKVGTGRDLSMHSKKL